jgi:GNAT superfamily N-acetyltransferase
MLEGMPRRVVPFQPEFAARAAALGATLAHAEASAVRAAIDDVLGQEAHCGVALFGGEQLQAYLLAAPVSALETRSPIGAHAAADPRDYADLYQSASATWLARDKVDHSLVVAAKDPAALEAWFSLSFGKQQVYAVRDTAPIAMPPGIQVRKASAEDAADIVAMGPLVAQHQAGPPVFSPPRAGFFEQLPASLARELARPEATFFIAHANGRAEGFALWHEAAPSLLVPPQACELALAATRPEARGRGVGSALLAHGLAWAHAQGYRWCVTDWRSTNLLSSRFWINRGFEPTAYRLHRRIQAP